MNIPLKFYNVYDSHKITIFKNYSRNILFPHIKFTTLEFNKKIKNLLNRNRKQHIEH